MSGGVLALYVSRQFLARFFLCLGAFAGLVQLLDLLDNTKDILARDGSGFSTVLFYMRLRIPSIALQMISISALLAALVTLLGLVARNEIVAMKSVGVSYLRLLATFAPAAALIALLQFTLGEWIVPQSDRTLQLWWEETAPRASESSTPREAGAITWVRRSDTIVAVGTIHLPGDRLDRLRIFDIDDTGLLSAMIIAERATFAGGRWQLSGVEKIDIRGNPTRVATTEWETTLRPEDFADLALPPRQYSIAALAGLIDRSKVGARNIRFYEAMLQKKFAAPVATFLMVLIAAPVAQTSRRRGGGGLAFALGIVVGFAFFVTDGLVLLMGESGVFPPFFAAWSPTILFASAAGAILLHTESM